MSNVVILEKKAGKPQLTQEEFIRRLDKVNPNRKFEIISEYRNIKSSILVKDNNGICSLTAENLLMGKNPSIKSAINKAVYFINIAKEIHGDKYDYSLVKYVNSKTKVKIICKNCEMYFYQIPSSHLRGANCSYCSFKHQTKIKTRTLEQFIQKAHIVHNFKYDYSKFIYVNTHVPGIIICPEHNQFMCSPANHQRGKGCMECSLLNQGFSKSKFIARSEGKESQFYILRFYNASEEFYKMGFTSIRLNNRFTKTKVPYDYEIIFTKVDRPSQIYDIEKLLLREYKPFRYQPELKFSGHTECFSLDLPLDEIIEFLN